MHYSNPNPSVTLQTMCRCSVTTSRRAYSRSSVPPWCSCQRREDGAVRDTFGEYGPKSWYVTALLRVGVVELLRKHEREIDRENFSSYG
jgi:hypothetical protein